MESMFVYVYGFTQPPHGCPTPLCILVKCSSSTPYFALRTSRRSRTWRSSSAGDPCTTLLEKNDFEILKNQVCSVLGRRHKPLASTKKSHLIPNHRTIWATLPISGGNSEQGCGCGILNVPGTFGRGPLSSDSNPQFRRVGAGAA